MSCLSYVNPLQGTDSIYGFSNGNTLPLVSMPWGMATWSLQSDEAGHGWFFHPEHRRFQGMRLTHQPSPWMGDYGHLVFMPQSGQLNLAPDQRAASYRPERLKLQPHYCCIDLPRYQVRMELVPTMRSACMRFLFARPDAARLIVASFKGEAEFAVDVVNRRITGFTRAHQGKVHPHFAQYVVMEFDCPLISDQSGIFDGTFTPDRRLHGAGDQVGVYAGLDLPDTGIAHMRIGTSFISLEQAELNLRNEQGGRQWEALKEQAAKTWEQRLGAVRVESDDEEELRTFYSCLYRTFLFPRTWHELDPQGNRIHFSPYDGELHKGPFYGDIGFWDVFRTSLPLYSLLFPALYAEMVESWIGIYRESGWLPKWISPAERSAMPGTLIDAVLADACVKGIPFDVQGAYEGLRKHATRQAEDASYGRIGLKAYLEYGYLPEDQFPESVSNSLDYYYGDFCIGQISRQLGYMEDHTSFRTRAAGYKRLFSPENGFLCGLDANGRRREGFDPLQWGDPYCEGGAWQCSWAVPHDIVGLAELMGGREAMVRKLEHLMTMEPDFKVGSYGMEIHEMSEMAAVDFGQFALSNQPSFHLPYIYTVLGHPGQTHYWLNKARGELFSSDKNGFPGDEDNGSLGAWYIWSALGLYPFCPGVPEYVLGTPLFRKATLLLENGKAIIVEALNHGAGHIHWDHLEIDGVSSSKLFVLHEQLVDGATLKFHMTKHFPQESLSAADWPYSMTKELAP